MCLGEQRAAVDTADFRPGWDRWRWRPTWWPCRSRASPSRCPAPLPSTPKAASSSPRTTQTGHARGKTQEEVASAGAGGKVKNTSTSSRKRSRFRTDLGVDESQQLALGRSAAALAWRGEVLPEDGVVQVAAACASDASRTRGDYRGPPRHRSEDHRGGGSCVRAPRPAPLNLMACWHWMMPVTSFLAVASSSLAVATLRFVTYLFGPSHAGRATGG